MFLKCLYSIIISFQAENSPCLTAMYAVSVHCKSFFFTIRLQFPYKTKLWAVLGLRQWRNWQRGFASFQIFPMACGGSQAISFLEAKLKTLKRINFTRLMSQFLSCVGSRVAETLCALTPLCNSVVTSPAERRVVSGLAPARQGTSLPLLDPQKQDFRNASSHPGACGTCSLLLVALCLVFVYTRSFSPVAYIHHWSKGLTGFIVVWFLGFFFFF